MRRSLITARGARFGRDRRARREATLRVGVARAISTRATLIAIERGYFKEFGIKIELEDINSSADVMAMIAQNQYQIVEGGISAGYFNAVEKNLPITLVANRTSSPLGHNIMLRPDLKDQITDIRSLKGKVIGTNGPGSVSTYEIGKVAGSGRAHAGRRGDQGHPVHADGPRAAQQGAGREPADSAIHLSGRATRASASCSLTPIPMCGRNRPRSR